MRWTHGGQCEVQAVTGENVLTGVADSEVRRDSENTERKETGGRIRTKDWVCKPREWRREQPQPTVVQSETARAEMGVGATADGLRSR